MTPSSLYPMKHLSEFFVPNGSFFETSILLTSMSHILDNFLFFVKITVVDLFVVENYVLSTHSYTW